MKSWKEYLDDQGKLIENPKEDIKADFKGKIPSKPSKPEISTGPDGEKRNDVLPKGEPNPYVAANSSKKGQKGEQGFGDLGSKELKYEPKTDGERQKIKSSWKKNKTEKFLKETKNMNSVEFINHMNVNECGLGMFEDDDDDILPTVTAYSAGKFHPHPPEVIKYLSVLGSKNNRIIDNMIHEMKRTGILQQLVESLLEHPETYDIMTDMMGDLDSGPRRCGCLAKSMNNNILKFLDEQEDLYESVDRPYGFNDDDEDFDLDDEEMPEEMPDDEEMPDEDFDLDDEEVVPNEDDFERKANKKSKRLKKRFAADHLTEAMHQHDAIKDRMKKYMTGY